MKPLTPIVFLMLLLTSCTKTVIYEIPEQQPKLVVEGHIESGSAPLVFLSKSVGFFNKVSIEEVNKSLVRDALVMVECDGIRDTLQLICIEDIPEDLLDEAAELIGVSIERLRTLRFCVYTSLNPFLLGVEGKSYRLLIQHQGKEYSSVTTIPAHLPLDSLWFELYGSRTDVGWVYANMTEPAGLGNCYRWFAKVLGSDQQFVAPLGSAFEDKFIDGRTFEFYAARGIDPNNPDSVNASEAFFFKRNDTVVVKFCTTDRAGFDFYRTFETEVANVGNPFASPGLIKTNIQGGALGIWGGYGVWLDTVVCVPR